MKSGTGDDPFEELDETEAEVVDDESKSEKTRGMSHPSSGEEQRAGSTSAETARKSVEGLPYLAQRQLKNRSVHADRDQIPFFLREEVIEGERELRNSVEETLGQEVHKTDLREAAYVCSQQHADEVAEILREWGIEYIE